METRKLHLRYLLIIGVMCALFAAILVSALTARAFTQSEIDKYDLDGNGTIDISDVARLLDFLGNYEVKEGFIEEDGGIRFYIGGEQVTGFTEFEGKRLYFDPDTGLMKSEAFELDGAFYEAPEAYAYEGMTLYLYGDAVSEARIIRASITTVNGTTRAAGVNRLTVRGSAALAAGDTVKATVSGHYLKVYAANISTAAILYLPDGEFTYTHASNASVYLPSSFCTRAPTFTFTIPTDEEIAARRNLAVNPFDDPAAARSFPHASSNNVYDRSGQFIPRNAIDGYKSNRGHGNYPYESWGPRATVYETDYFTVDFSREVTLDEVALYLRADGFGSSGVSHDAYFSTVVFEFSDGSTVTVHPEKSYAKQSFTFDPVRTTYLKCTGFVTDTTDSQGWAGFSEVEAYGADLPADPDALD